MRESKLPEISDSELSLASFRMELMKIELTEDADIDHMEVAEAKMMNIYEDYLNIIRTAHSKSGGISTIALSTSWASMNHGDVPLCCDFVLL